MNSARGQALSKTLARAGPAGDDRTLSPAVPAYAPSPDAGAGNPHSERRALPAVASGVSRITCSFAPRRRDQIRLTPDATGEENLERDKRAREAANRGEACRNSNRVLTTSTRRTNMSRIRLTVGITLALTMTHAAIAGFVLIPGQTPANADFGPFLRGNDISPSARYQEVYGGTAFGAASTQPSALRSCLFIPTQEAPLLMSPCRTFRFASPPPRAVLMD